MASVAVSDAVEVKLSEWVSLAACPFVDLNNVSDVPLPPYLEIEYPASNEDIIAVGGRGPYRESGGILFVITVAVFTGKRQAGLWADELRALFRGQEFGAGVKTWEAQPAVFDESNRDSTKYRVPFSVRYTYDVMT